MMDTTVAAIKLATACASYGMGADEIEPVLREAGYTPEQIRFALGGRNVLGEGYTCAPQTGNRSEACVQVLG